LAGLFQPGGGKWQPLTVTEPRKKGKKKPNDYFENAPAAKKKQTGEYIYIRLLFFSLFLSFFFFSLFFGVFVFPR
jgi:hypothetical protein